VAISVSERRGGLHATVCDDGRGFASRRRRSRTSKSMGIATARERIRAHGGSFDVTSAPGEGTTVEFSLPLPSR
jgi:signal transduction histidine kinase